MQLKKSILMVFSCLMMCSLLFSGCGNTENDPNTANTPNPAEEDNASTAGSQITYTDGRDSFSVQFSDQWQQSEKKADDPSIELDYEDIQASLKIQRYDKSVMTLQDVNNLDQFVTLHQKAAVSVLLAMAESAADAALDTSKLPFVTNSQVQEISYKQEEQATKSYLAYLETSHAYYFFQITAPANTYDKFINTWSQVVLTLQELNAEDTASEDTGTK